MFEFLSEFTERTDSSRSSIAVRSRPPSRAPSPEAESPSKPIGAERVRAEVGEVLEVRLRQRGGVADRLFRRDRAVGLDREHETIVVRALADARLGDGEVGATNRIVDRVDADEVDGETAIDRVLVGLDVAATLVDVQVDVEVAVVLKREEVVRGLDDARAAGRADVARGDGAGLGTRDVQDDFLDVVRPGSASTT